MSQSTQQIHNWPWKHIWRTNIPQKVACFVRFLAKEAVLAQGTLMKRKITRVPDALCVELKQRPLPTYYFIAK